jgi:sulfur carrier protein ThiS
MAEQASFGTAPFTVMVGQLPGQIKPCKVQPGSTAEAVVRQAGFDPAGYEIRVDNQPVALSTVVFANQTVLLLRPVRGNSELVTVMVGQLPGQIKPCKVIAGSTAESVVRQAGFDPAGYEIRVDNEPVELSRPVWANQTVLLLRPVRGNTELVTVMVGQLPGQIKPCKVIAGSTAESVVRQAGFDPAGYEIRVDNEPVELSRPVWANQTVLLLRPVRGN